MLGISAFQLIVIFILLVIILLLLFAFILWGVTAFAFGGNFGALINSLLPIGSGVGLSQKSTDDPNSKEFSSKT